MLNGLEEILKADSAKSTKIDCTQAVEEYINKSDWRIFANANTGYSNAGLVNGLAGKVIANYWLDKVYSKKEGDAHRNGDYHIHDLDCLSGYCCGHDLQRLLNEGFNGVVGRVGSKPPKHFREALYQMANFIGILQAEWGGAQAFSSFDTYLAPYVFFDMYYTGLGYKDVKKAVLNFIYNLNVPSRWGQCVPESYKCLKADGTWVNHKDLKVGDQIFVVDLKTGKLKKDTITRVNVYDAPEKMHRYDGQDGFNFSVTPNHKVINKTESGDWKLNDSSELLEQNKPVSIPVSQWAPMSVKEYMTSEFDINDSALELIAQALIGGHVLNQKEKTDSIKNDSKHVFSPEEFEKLSDILDELFDSDNHKIPSFIQQLSPRQANIILDTWFLTSGTFDGNIWKMYAGNKQIQEMLAYLILITGKSVTVNEQAIGDGNKVPYTVIHKDRHQSCEIQEVDSSCNKVWCPTTKSGTFICMTDEGYVFFTGNSPFSNITIDWTVPNDMREQYPLRGDKHYFETIFDNLIVSEESNKEQFSNFLQEVKNRLEDTEEEIQDINDIVGDKEKTIDFLKKLTYKHFQKEMNLINKAFYECLNEGDINGLPFTFPIPTVNITENFDWDGENTDILFENAAKYGSSYFQNFIGSQYKRNENGELVPDPNAYSPNDVRSMCPLSGDTEVLTLSGHGISKTQMVHLDENAHKVFSNGTWCSFKRVEIKPQKLYEVTLSNGTSIKMGEYHLQPTYDGTKECKELKIGDLIPFNSRLITCDKVGGDYQLGYVIGAYYGNGSSDGNTVTYSLSLDEKDNLKEEKLTNFWTSLGYHVDVKNTENSVRLVRVTRNAFSLIERFCKGNDALTKGIHSSAFSLSPEARQGIIDGYIGTDCDKDCKRISTSSKTMADDLLTLFTLQGKKALLSSIDECDDNPNYIVSYSERNNYDDFYKTLNDKLYFTIKDIKEIPQQKLYCIEIDNEDHTFVLGNGMITHNCRLQLDKRELRKRGGGLFGSDAQTGCYDEETEVLTKEGWKYFKDVTLDDEFYTLSNNRVIELHKPINLFRYEHNGKMCHFKTRHVDLLVTPNHRMLLTHSDKDNFRFKEAKDCNHHFIAPLSGNWKGEEKEFHTLEPIEKIIHSKRDYETIKIPMNIWLKFLGLFISEGSVRGSEYDYEIIITQRKSINFSIIDEVMNSMPFEYKRYEYNGTIYWSIRSKQLWNELSPLGNSRCKKIPNYVFDLSPGQMQILFDYLIVGDGHIRKDNNHIEYHTSSIQLRDDVQRLAMLMGYAANILEYSSEYQNKKNPTIDGRKITSKNTSYTVSIHIDKNRDLRGYTEENYNGFVYCAEVPNNTLYVRRRGKTIWCGNSIGVVTINLARLGYLYKGDIKGLYKKLLHLMDLAKSTLEKKRVFVQELFLRGLYPYTRRYLKSFNTFFSTIGVNGMNELVRNFSNDEYDITSEKGRKMSLDILNFIRNKIADFQEETGNLYNLEATPAEGTTYRFAKEDIKRFDDIIHAGTDEEPYYTNSSQLPANFTDDAFEALDHQDDLQCCYTGGCVEAGNMVMTNYGLIKIEEIVKNFNKDNNLSVISYNTKTNKAEWDKVIDAMEIDVSQKDRINIKGSGYFDITTSDWHPFFVLQKDNSIIEKRADEIKIGDRLIKNETNMFKTKTKDDIPNDIAYMLGYFIADGSMSLYYDNRDKNNLKRYSVRFSAQNITQLERINTILKNNNLCNINIIQNDKRSPNLCELVTKSKNIADLLINYGFTAGTKTYTVNINEKIREGLNNENAWYLLSGLIDGDGHFDKQDDMEYATASKQLAEDILWLSAMLGINATCTEKYNKKDKTITHKIMISHRCLYRNEENLQTEKKLKGIYKEKARSTWERDTVLVKDVSKLTAGDDIFYDLTTENNHNYLCGKKSFVFIHNTVLHLYMSERLSDASTCKKMVRKVCENYRLPYISVTPTYSTCPIHGYIPGEHEFCPYCDQEILNEHAKELNFNQ